jgi:hypothetical protein
MALSTSTKLADVRSDRLSAQAEWETSTLRDFLVNNLVKESSAAHRDRARQSMLIR